MPFAAHVADALALKTIRFKRILFATDFSDASDRALNYALALVRKYGAELVLVHAVQAEPGEPILLDPPSRDLDPDWLKADQQMERLVTSPAFQEIQYKEVIRRGPVVEVVANVMREEECDLLLTGTHGRRGLAKLALGSIAEQILHLTMCPVLTVGPHVATVPKGGAQISKILFATDFGEASRKAFPYGVAIAREFQAKLTLLHMIDPMPAAEITPAAYGPPSYAAEEFSRWRKARKEESLDRLHELVEAVNGLIARPRCEVGMDLVPQGILETARLSECNLIVLGVNHVDSSRLASHFPWALISEVIRKAKCPVLTVCA